MSTASDPTATPASNRTIDFYFDFSSPYSYLATTWIEDLAAAHGRSVCWHAILLGATFKAAELKSPVSHPLKGDYTLRDLLRSARIAGVPLTMPEPFPIATQNPARVFGWLWERDPATAKAFARAGLQAYFTRGLDVSQPAGLAELATTCGLDPAEVAQVAADPVWKDRLRQTNDDAIARGVFGAPFFIVDGEPFWGNDRQAQLAHWLAHGSGPTAG